MLLLLLARLRASSTSPLSLSRPSAPVSLSRCLLQQEHLLQQRRTFAISRDMEAEADAEEAEDDAGDNLIEEDDEEVSRLFACVGCDITCDGNALKIRQFARNAFLR